MFRTYKYRLYPTPSQSEVLGKFAGTVRYFYNLALEQRRDYFRQYRRQTGHVLNYISQGREITELRRHVPWVAETPAIFLHSALRDLDRAFTTFYRGGGFPKFRKMGARDGFAVKAADTKTRSLNKKWSQVYIPKLGWVKFRDTRLLDGSLKALRVVCQNGDWFACIGVHSELTPQASSLPAVGIDRGVKISLALSSGQSHTLAGVAGIERKVRKAKRVMARRQRGSCRYLAARKRVARLSAKAARIRRDWQHKTTTKIACQFGTVVLEDLKTRRMTARAHGSKVAQKRGLNRAILNVGWHSLETLLLYKLKERGGTLLKVNPAYTSQTCSACGTIDKGSRESQARFACLHCGHEMNADHNAAINILRQGLAGVDGCGYAPDEARTIHPRLAA